MEETSTKRRSTPKTTVQFIKASVPTKTTNAMTWCPIIYLSSVVKVRIITTMLNVSVTKYPQVLTRAQMCK